MTAVSPDAAFTVIIPAYNEAAGLERCLASWVGGLADGEAEILVAANGCTDDTAEVARSWGVRVLDLPEPSKSAALRAADSAIKGFPRIYMDADVTTDVAVLRAMRDALATDQARLAAPRVVFRTDRSSRWVRAFYRVFERTPYVTEELGSAGIYGLSRSGRERFSEFPDLVADDLFVQSHFSRTERLRVEGAVAVEAPRTLAGLLRIRRRTVFGNRELHLSGLSGDGLYIGAKNSRRTARRLLTSLPRERRVGHLADLAVYVSVVVVARLHAKLTSSSKVWLRDESSRTTG